MTTSGRAAYGTLLKRSGTTLAEVTNLSGPSMNVDPLEMTSHDSSGNREFIGGLFDGGEVTAEVNFMPGNATHKQVIADLKARTISTWSIVYPDASTYSFSALVTGFEPSAPVDGKLSATITLKVTGSVMTPA